MLKWFATKQLDRFQERWGYDTSYVREILEEAGVPAVAPLQALGKLSAFRRDVPISVYHAAALTAAKAADCGPCLQLGVSMAQEQGVAPELIRAIVQRDFERIPKDALLGVELALGTIARDGTGDEARDEVLRRWGRAGLVSLAYAIVAAQAYPAFKYAVGHGRACVRLRVGNETIAMQPEAV